MSKRESTRRETKATVFNNMNLPNVSSKFGQSLTHFLNSWIAQLVKNPPAMQAGHPGLIPGQGRSPGEGIGYLLQSSWASLVAQLVKNRL